MNRLGKVKKFLRKDFDALFVSSVPNITYLINFTGFSNEEREAYLLITKRNCYVFTDARYSETIRKIKGLKLIEISSSKNFKQKLKEILIKKRVKKLAIDEDDLRTSEFKEIKDIAKICSDQNLIEKLRLIKDETEIKNIKNACILGDKVFNYILSEIKPNVTEKEIAQKIKLFIFKNGGELSFRPIVAFGQNSSSPHHVSTDRKLKENETVLLDFGVKINHYCSDMTRTIFMGNVNEKQKKIYETVLQAQQKAIKSIKSSQIKRKPISCLEIDAIARKHIESHGFPTIPHSLGHGIGIRVHEKPSLSPRSKDELKTGMVFSIEPGIYIPGFGGIRIEDLVFVTKNGLQILTRSSRKLIEL